MQVGRLRHRGLQRCLALVGADNQWDLALLARLEQFVDGLGNDVAVDNRARAETDFFLAGRFEDLFPARCPHGRERLGSILDAKRSRELHAHGFGVGKLRERSDVARPEPLSTIALWNRPSVSGDAICEITFVPPPDSPMIVTLSGSPPKARCCPVSTRARP